MTDRRRAGVRIPVAAEGWPFIFPLAVAEVGVTRPRGEDERVVAHVASVQIEAPGGQVHLLDVGEEHRDVGRAAQDRPERGGDIGRVQRRGGDLVEERLEEVMVAPVE